MLGARCGGAFEPRAGDFGEAAAARQPRAAQVGAGKVGVVQLCSAQIGVDPDAVAGLHPVQNGIAGGDLAQGRALELGAAAVGRLQAGLVEVGFIQARASQTREAQIGAPEVRFLQLRTTQVDAAKVQSAEVGSLQLRRRGPGIGRQRLLAAVGAVGAVAMPDQVMTQQQGVLADVLAVRLRQQFAGCVEDAAIAGALLVRSRRQIGEQQIAEHADGFRVEAGGVERCGECLGRAAAGVDLPQAAGDEEFEKALVREAVKTVAAAHQEGGGAQFEIDALVVHAGGEVGAVFAHQTGEIAVVQALVGARPQRRGQGFEQHGHLLRRELHFRKPQAWVVEPLLGIDQVEGARRRLVPAGLERRQAVQDDVQQLRHARQIVEAVDRLDVGPGLPAGDRAEALAEVFANLCLVEGQQVVERGLKAARGDTERRFGVDRLGDPQSGLARLSAITEEMRARSDQHPVGLWRGAGLRGGGGELAELFLDAPADGGDAHFIEAVEQQDDAPGRQQMQQDGGVDRQIEFATQVFLQQLLERYRVREVLQVDGDRHRRVAVAGAVVGQRECEVRHEGGFAGTVIAEQQPQPAAGSACPGARARNEVDHRALGLVSEADLLLHVPAGQRTRFVRLSQAG